MRKDGKLTGPPRSTHPSSGRMINSVRTKLSQARMNACQHSPRKLGGTVRGLDLGSGLAACMPRGGGPSCGRSVPSLSSGGCFFKLCLGAGRGPSLAGGEIWSRLTIVNEIWGADVASAAPDWLGLWLLFTRRGESYASCRGPLSVDTVREGDTRLS